MDSVHHADSLAAELDKNNITVIIPAYNEEKYIRDAVYKVVHQQWDGQIEIIVVDGASTDRTVAILHEIALTLPANRSLKVLTNPLRSIPLSLNMACRQASYDIIVRTDAHTYVPDNYVALTVRTLEQIGYHGIAGGRITILPGDDTCLAQAIALAVSHRLGVGNAAYRTLDATVTEPLDADTVPFGAFTKRLWEELGGYDEALLFDEDYDLNYRARKHGLRVVLNPQIELKYFARKDLNLLWQQYYRYGFWAFRFCRKHNVIPNIRRFIPAAFVLGLMALIILGLAWSFIPLGLYLLAYLLPITAVSLNEAYKKKSLPFAFCLAPVFPVLHLSYGFGSLFSCLKRK